MAVHLIKEEEEEEEEEEEGEGVRPWELYMCKAWVKGVGRRVLSRLSRDPCTIGQALSSSTQGAAAPFSSSCCCCAAAMLAFIGW